jgi:hypothetical protein
MKARLSTRTEILLLSCLSDDEKSLFDLSRLSSLGHETVRRVMLRLTRDDVVERRWEKAPVTKNKDILKYLYKRKTNGPRGSAAGILCAPPGKTC